MSNALEITGLHKRFRHFELKNISFCLPEGYIMGLIGPNGAGKTTVIKLILNLIINDKGDIRVFGLDHISHEEEIKENIVTLFLSSAIIVVSYSLSCKIFIKKDI